ncbi:DUF362 domain-containing protein [Methanoculleus sp.]|uniref:DUF362 domain-containing protein n=1 Tax=Methanoculleus sp. TaxID=90427 RepID=UPI002F41B7BA
MTGAAKNLFGLIPGLEKPVFHFRFRDEADFGRMLVDLNELIRPTIQIMDAVVGNGGNGPQARTPRQDRCDPRKQPLHRHGRCDGTPDGDGSLGDRIDPERRGPRGLVRSDLTNVRTVGEPLEDLIVADFQKPSTCAGKGGGSGSPSPARSGGRTLRTPLWQGSGASAAEDAGGSV